MKKVLIIAGGLQVGGAEKVCANISKYSPKGEFEYHYLVFEGIENVYGKEVEERGGTVFTVPSPSKSILKYCLTLGRIIKNKKYDIVHSHTMFNSGINMVISKLCGVKIRIVHSHTTEPENRISVPKRIYYFISRFLINHFATDFLSCGQDAGEWLFGKKAFCEKGIIVFNGIDTDDFRFNMNESILFRKSLALSDAFVIGHVGSLFSVKNQQFLIKLMPEICKRKPSAKLILVGNGDERIVLQKLSKELELDESVVFVGETLDTVKYYNIFDVFAFPSLREGTPLALLEAQTNGLPCVVSDSIPRDAYITDLVHPVSLSDEKKWVDLICSSKRNDSEKYSDIVAEKGYSARQSYEKIYDVYRG